MAMNTIFILLCVQNSNLTLFHVSQVPYEEM